MDSTFHWTLAAPFIHSKDDTWLTAYVPPGAHTFSSVPASYHHDRSRPSTTARQWLDYILHGSRAWSAASSHRGRSGVLTCFPQLPVAVGLRKRMSTKHLPIVAWTFNIGVLPAGLKRKAAVAALQSVDRFIVHSRAEIRSCSQWLNIPQERFAFVPLQRAVIEPTFSEDTRNPFLLSMGSAHRDYRLLFDVVRRLNLRTVVVCGPHALEGLQVPSCVEVRTNLSLQQCHQLAQQARINVIPVDNQHTASGQVTLVDSMMFSRPTVVTSGPASDDYVRHGHDGWLVPAGDEAALREAIQRFWEDPALRQRVGAQARRTVIEQWSDPAIGQAMGRVLGEVSQAAT